MSQPKPYPATHFRMPLLAKPAAVMHEKPAKPARRYPGRYHRLAYIFS